jgi:calcium-dependent protein kinase
VIGQKSELFLFGKKTNAFPSSFSYIRVLFLEVLELCDGGDLYTRSPYSERESARILQQILSAVRYMHDHGIVHRDLKFENIMFENNSPSARVKIIDFGLSKKFLGKPSYMTERVGTVYTMAPQVLQGVYSSQADLWSTGVIAYMLLSASKPFYHKRRRKMIDQIMRADFGYNAPVWKQISESAQDFVSRLLVVDPKKRLNAEKALDHSWIVNRERLPDETPSEDLLAAVDDCLVNYRQTSELKKLALNMIAHRSTAEEIMQLRKVFDSYDTSNDGIITFDEFKAALHKMNYPDEIVQEVFSSIDVNRNGHIQYTEFIASTVLAQGHIAEDRVAVAFDRLDSDDTGFISKKNLQNALGKEYTPELVENILEEVDTDRDGKISYTEFLQYFRKETSNLADRASLLEQQSSHVSEHGLVGLDAKIPGGPYDPNRT